MPFLLLGVSLSVTVALSSRHTFAKKSKQRKKKEKKEKEKKMM